MFVPIIMGSKKDMVHGEAIASALETFGISSEIRIASAHKAVLYLLDILAVYEADPRPKVYVTIAGRANALSAVVDTNVQAPVIACPPYSDKFGGGDVYSSLRSPSGVAPVVILEPGGTALAAAKMLSLAHPEMRAQIRTHQEANTARIKADDKELRS